jgi:uncharacterized protein
MGVLYYLDSSAWVKRYFTEAGSAWVATVFRREISLASSVLGYIEVAPTLARRRHASSSLPVLQQQLHKEWTAMFQLDLSSGAYEEALGLAWNQKLRGADAIHLAAALQLREQTVRCSLDFVFVTADDELVRAAQSLDVAVTNPAEVT